MREKATDPYCERGGRRQSALNAWRFGPLCHLGYTISGSNDTGFKAVDPATGKTIRRLKFENFRRVVRAAGMTRAARSKLLEKRATPEYRLRERVKNQRLTLLELERREVCPSKRQPRPRPIRPAATERRVRLNNCGTVVT